MHRPAEQPGPAAGGDQFHEELRGQRLPAVCARGWWRVRAAGDAGRDVGEAAELRVRAAHQVIAQQRSAHHAGHQARDGDQQRRGSHHPDAQRRAPPGRRAAGPRDAVTGPRSRRDSQHVPESADGVDEPRLALVDLAPQVADTRFDQVAVARQAVFPDVVPDLALLTTRPALAIRNRSSRNSVGVSVMTSPARLTSCASSSSSRSATRSREQGAGLPGALEYRPDPCQHLIEAERLGDVVIGPQVQPGDPVRHLVAGGQEDHGDAARGRPAGGGPPRSRRRPASSRRAG